MLRITGAVLVVFAGSMIGFLKSDGLLKRARLLGKIITGLNLLKAQIGYGRTSLRDALLSIGRSQDIELFSKTAENMTEKGIKSAVLEALETCGEHLKGEDKEPIIALAENLGMTDAKTQESAIETAVITLATAKNQADEEYARLGKMYRSIGVLGGLLGAILFI